MIKMRNVGAQTLKKWRPGGPPARREGGPKGGARRAETSGPAAWGLEGWGPEGRGPKISCFFPSPATFFFLSSLSGCLLVEFWLCF